MGGERELDVWERRGDEGSAAVPSSRAVSSHHTHTRTHEPTHEPCLPMHVCPHLDSEEVAHLGRAVHLGGGLLDDLLLRRALARVRNWLRPESRRTEVAQLARSVVGDQHVLELMVQHVM